MSENLLIHIFMKVNDLNIHFENRYNFNFKHSHFDQLKILLCNLSAYHLNQNDDLYYMCIILQNVQRSPNPHLCSNFQENKRFKTYDCNCLITSPEQFLVMCHQLFGNGLTVYQLWQAFTKVPKCFTQKLKHSLQTCTTWQPFLFKGHYIL